MRVLDRPVRVGCLPACLRLSPSPPSWFTCVRPTAGAVRARLLSLSMAREGRNQRAVGQQEQEQAVYLVGLLLSNVAQFLVAFQAGGPRFVSGPSCRPGVFRNSPGREGPQCVILRMMAPSLVERALRFFPPQRRLRTDQTTHGAEDAAAACCLHHRRRHGAAVPSGQIHSSVSAMGALPFAHPK